MRSQQCRVLPACTGKSAERPVLAVEEIEANVAGIRGTLQKLLAASDHQASDLRPAVFLNNLVSAALRTGQRLLAQNKAAAPGVLLGDGSVPCPGRV